MAGFTEAPALPTAPLTAAELLEATVSDPVGPIGMLTDEAKVIFRGDAEAGLALTLVDRWDRGNRRGGVRAAVEGLVRFPTGRVARTDRLLALGTGDGQTDVEARGTLDLGGGRWGVRLEGRYNRQLAADLVDRVAPPSQPYPARDLLALVRFDPGDETSFAARPFFRIAIRWRSSARSSGGTMARTTMAMPMGPTRCRGWMPRCWARRPMPAPPCSASA